MVCRSVNGKCQLILLGVMLVILGTCCAVARVFFTPLTENMQFSDFLFSASAAVAGSIGAIVLHLSYLTLLCKIPIRQAWSKFESLAFCFFLIGLFLVLLIEPLGFQFHTFYWRILYFLGWVFLIISALALWFSGFKVKRVSIQAKAKNNII